MGSCPPLAHLDVLLAQEGGARPQLCRAKAFARAENASSGSRSALFSEEKASVVPKSASFGSGNSLFAEKGLCMPRAKPLQRMRSLRTGAQSLSGARDARSLAYEAFVSTCKAPAARTKTFSGRATGQTAHAAGRTRGLPALAHPDTAGAN